MQKLTSWIKTNKLASLLILIVAYFLLKGSSSVSPLTFNRSNTASLKMTNSAGIGGGSADVSYQMNPNIALPSVESNVPPSTNQNRLVVQESNMSLVVKNVSPAVDEITNFAKENGGFMISSSLSNPADAAFATVEIRIPQEKLKDTLTFLRGLAVKVSSENLMGTDVTDQYEDIQARLDTQNQVKAKFQEIMLKATVVSDILTVQRELINVQNQIDALKGQQQYLAKTSALSKVTIYLSTDELALPYAPNEPFRPSVIFKTAVRSLLLNLQNIAGALIYIIVFSVIWGPALVIFLLVRRFLNRNK